MDIAAAPSQQRVAPINRRRAWILTILGLVGVFVILVGIKAGQIGSMISAGKHFVLPPEAVTTARVEALEWQSSRAAVGTLIAVRGVTLGAEIAGTVRQIGFDSGQFVHRGDVLVKLDTSVEEAQLAGARADAELAKVSLERARRLRASATNTPADLDAALSRYRQASANAAVLEATIARKTIRAPFDGRVAIRQVELGQVLSSGAAVASLQSITPIHAEFWLPQQTLAALKVGMQARLSTDVFPKQGWEGVVTAINSEVDVNTRNVKVRATFPNADGRLRPGMFGNVEVVSPEKRSVLVIPATAVIYAPYGDSVFTVDNAKDASGHETPVAHSKFVRLGEHRGDLVEVESGLTGGETVVASGAFKLHNGSTVKIQSGQDLGAEIAPKPVER